MSVILCTAGYDHFIRFWEALSGICSRTIQHPESQVNRLCISPDKRLLAAAGSEEVKLYDIRSTNPAPILTFKGHRGNVTGVAFHIEGKWMVTSSEDGTVKIWDTRMGTVQRDYNHGSPVNDVVIHPNQGELISCDRAGNVRVWDLGENKCTHQLVPEEDVSVASVTVATDGTLLCAGNNLGNIFVWRMLQNQDVTSLIPVTSFQAHGTYITRVLLSPDVRKLATCSADHNARIWTVIDPMSASSVDSNMTSSTHSTNSNGGGPVIGGPPAPTSAAGNGAASVVNHSSENPHGVAQMNGSGVNGVANGNAASASQSNGAKNLPADLRKDRPATAFPLECSLGAHQRWVWDCAFSADSAYLVTASSDHYARLWELATQSVIRQYNGHHRGAVCVALNDYSETR